MLAVNDGVDLKAARINATLASSHAKLKHAESLTKLRQVGEERRAFIARSMEKSAELVEDVEDMFKDIFGKFGELSRLKVDLRVKSKALFSSSKNIRRGYYMSKDVLEHFKNVKEVCDPKTGLLKDVGTESTSLASGLLTRYISQIRLVHEARDYLRLRAKEEGQGRDGINRLAELMSMACNYETDYNSLTLRQLLVENADLTNGELERLFHEEYFMPGFQIESRSVDPDSLVWRTEGYKDASAYLRLIQQAHIRVNRSLMLEFELLLQKFADGFEDDMVDLVFFKFARPNWRKGGLMGEMLQHHDNSQTMLTFDEMVENLKRCLPSEEEVDHLEKLCGLLHLFDNPLYLQKLLRYRTHTFEKACYYAINIELDEDRMVQGRETDPVHREWYSLPEAGHAVVYKRGTYCFMSYMAQFLDMLEGESDLLRRCVPRVGEKNLNIYEREKRAQTEIHMLSSGLRYELRRFCADLRTYVIRDTRPMEQGLMILLDVLDLLSRTNYGHRLMEALRLPDLRRLEESSQDVGEETDGGRGGESSSRRKVINLVDALDLMPHSIQQEQPLQDEWVETVRAVMEEGWARLVKLEKYMAPGGKMWSDWERRDNGTVHPMVVQVFYQLQLYHRHHESISQLLKTGDRDLDNDSSDDDDEFMVSIEALRESAAPTEWNSLIQRLLNAVEHRLHVIAKEFSDVGIRSLFLMNCYEHMATAATNSFVESDDGEVSSYLCKGQGWERKGFDLLHEKIEYFKAEQNRHRDVFVYSMLQKLLDPLTQDLARPSRDPAVDQIFEKFGDRLEKLLKKSVRSNRKVRIPNLDLQAEIRSDMVKTIMKVYVAFHTKNAAAVSSETAVLLPNDLDRMLRNNLFPPEEAEKAQWRAGAGEYGLQSIQALRDLGSNAVHLGSNAVDSVRDLGSNAVHLGSNAVGSVRDLGSNALSTVTSTSMHMVDVGMRAIIIEDDHGERMQALRGSSVDY